MCARGCASVANTFWHCIISSVTRMVESGAVVKSSNPCILEGSRVTYGLPIFFVSSLQEGSSLAQSKVLTSSNPCDRGKYLTPG
jgi:hypothetical protein